MSTLSITKQDVCHLSEVVQARCRRTI